MYSIHSEHMHHQLKFYGGPSPEGTAGPPHPPSSQTEIRVSLGTWWDLLRKDMFSSARHQPGELSLELQAVCASAMRGDPGNGTQTAEEMRPTEIIFSEPLDASGPAIQSAPEYLELFCCLSKSI